MYNKHHEKHFISNKKKTGIFISVTVGSNE